MIAIKTIDNGKITLNEADEDQRNLLVEIMSLKIDQNRKIQRKNKKKKIFLKTCVHFLMVEKKFLMFLKTKYFQ